MAGGFVAGVLEDELAGEGLFQDGLAEGGAALQGGVDLPLVLLDGRELLVEKPHDLLLLGEGAEGDEGFAELCRVDAWPTDTMNELLKLLEEISRAQTSEQKFGGQ